MCLNFFFFMSFPQSKVAEKGRELKELKDTLALVVREKEKLEGVGDSFHFLFYRLLRSKYSLKRVFPLQFALSHSGLCLICL